PRAGRGTSLPPSRSGGACGGRGHARPRLSRPPATHGHRRSAPRQEARVRVAASLPAMSEGNVQLDHEVAVARCVHRAVRGVAALDDPRKGQGGKLALGEALVDAGPNGRALSGVFANGERMQETQPPRIRDALETLGGALVVVVGRSFRYSQSETTMPKQVPNTTRYANARTLPAVQRWASPASRSASGASTRTDAHVPTATIGIGALRVRKRDCRTAATAQVTGMSTSRSVARSAFGPSPASGAPTRSA